MMGNIKINLVRNISGDSESDILLYFDTFKQTLTTLVSKYPWCEGTTLVLNKNKDNKYEISGNILITDENVYDNIFDFFYNYKHGVESHIVSFIQKLYDKWCYCHDVEYIDFTLTQTINLTYSYRRLFAETLGNGLLENINLNPSYARYFKEKMLSLLVDDKAYLECTKQLKNFKLEITSEYIRIIYLENISETLAMMDRNIELVSNLLGSIKAKRHQLKYFVIFYIDEDD